ncbi:MAG: L-histidine N(alpha)-methyltransferase [Polyangia bacterium]
MQTPAEPAGPHPDDAFAEFPTLISSDNSVTTAFVAALYHLRQALGAILALPVTNSSERHMAQEQLRDLVSTALPVLHVFFSDVPEEGSDGEGGAATDRPVPSGLRFCDRLRLHREAAGLTQADLAQLSGLSRSLVRRLEQGSLSPSRGALVSLCAVPELRLVPAMLRDLSAGGRYPVSPNWYVPPGFDSVQMLGELAQQLNGGSGSIEQTYVYLDHQSASDWIALSNEPDYVARFRDRMPLDAVAQRVHQAIGGAGLDVVALGPGDGRSEVRLVQHLLSTSADPSIRLYLLDASQPLLGSAFRHAMDTLADQRGVFVCAIQGSFHHLPRYLQLNYMPQSSHRRRLYTLLGGTLGNLESEPQFFQNGLAGSAPGDLLVLDMLPAYGSPDQPEALWQKDPTLRGEVSPAYRKFLGGPIRRYCPGVDDIRFSWRLDVHRPILGSYGLEIIAEVAQSGQPRRSLSVYRSRRYEPSGLVQCLRRMGWVLLGDLPFGASDRPARMLLFQRRMTTH